MATLEFADGVLTSSGFTPDDPNVDFFTNFVDAGDVYELSADSIDPDLGGNDTVIP